MTDTTPDSKIAPFRALDLLVKGGYAPLVKRREPYWRPATPECYRAVRTPAWSWLHPDRPPYGTRVTLDANAAFLSAISSATFAHGVLDVRGLIPEPGKAAAPGYYLIERPVWNVRDLVSPLGTADLPEKVWVAHPTLDLLHDVAYDGHMALPIVHDCHVSASPCRMRKWASHLRDVRAAVIAERDADTFYQDDDAAARYDAAVARYQAIKDGYAIAVQMFLGKDEQREAKSPVRRPDWYHTVHAQHAASMWRKAYRCWQAGHGPIGMGAVDELQFTYDDYMALGDMERPILRLNQTGESLGTFKIKSMETIPFPPVDLDPAARPDPDDTYDVPSQYEDYMERTQHPAWSDEDDDYDHEDA